MKHLEMGGVVWCDDDVSETTDDPRDSTCIDCLRRAAAYGAAAAMRYAAVEAGATQDPELVRERDEALRRLNAIGDALELQGAFFCHDCLKLKRVDERKISAGAVAWCRDCAPQRRVPT